jgi:hypothetical protein
VTRSRLDAATDRLLGWVVRSVQPTLGGGVGLLHDPFDERLEHGVLRLEIEVERRPGDLRPLGELVHADLVDRLLGQ